MTKFPEGNAIVYCQGAFNTPNGKTAHGLVRKTRRYNILSVVDSRYAGKDAGTVLDNSEKGIPVVGDIQEAINSAKNGEKPATHLVIGIAPDGGRFDPAARKDILQAIEAGLNIDSGLHDFLSDDPEIAAYAEKYNVKIRDIRKTPGRKDLHFFNGNIEKVACLKVAVLGTDSAVGKRTTAWLIVDAFQKAGYKAEMIGTGQTAWMQGAGYSIILDSLINDFVSGEIENAVWSAWEEKHPDVIVIEGQGSLMNPAYPGGFEILAAGRPDVVILQHAPARKEYDGFPGYPLHPVEVQIKAIELISGKPVVAITVNHEDLDIQEVPAICQSIEQASGLPTADVLLDGAGRIAEVLKPYLKK
jgi:uncharacterized NAD-dependent epimerase/dehydratase family protein